MGDESTLGVKGEEASSMRGVRGVEGVLGERVRSSSALTEGVVGWWDSQQQHWAVKEAFALNLTVSCRAIVVCNIVIVVIIVVIIVVTLPLFDAWRRLQQTVNLIAARRERDPHLKEQACRLAHVDEQITNSEDSVNSSCAF